jgi:hypothetical protein
VIKDLKMAVILMEEVYLQYQMPKDLWRCHLIHKELWKKVIQFKIVKRCHLRRHIWRLSWPNFRIKRVKAKDGYKENVLFKLTTIFS